MKPSSRSRPPRRAHSRVRAITLLITLIGVTGAPAASAAAAVAQDPPAAGPVATQASVSAEGASSLEAAASRAGQTGRKVAMSLIALAFAVASIVLAFRRDFKEAAGVFAVGIVAVLLASPAGVSVLRDTVNSLFGSS
jgi:hypothetical protein